MFPATTSLPLALLLSLSFWPHALSSQPHPNVPDPQLSLWTEVGQTFQSANSTLQNQEAEGFATDGRFWYLPTNTPGSKAIYKVSDSGQILDSALLPFPDGHAGSASVYEEWVYVPVQRPQGIWKLHSSNFSHNEWHPVNTTQNLFSWVAVNPLNGKLYTARQDIQNDTSSRRIVYAFNRTTLARTPEEDILLGKTPILLANLQGAVFTKGGYVMLVTSGLRAFPEYENYLFVFSAAGRNKGRCFGVKGLGDWGDEGSQVQSVAVRRWLFGGEEKKMGWVHVLQLRGDGNFVVHGFEVPRPGEL